MLPDNFWPRTIDPSEELVIGGELYYAKFSLQWHFVDGVWKSSTSDSYVLCGRLGEVFQIPVPEGFDARRRPLYQKYLDLWLAPFHIEHVQIPARNSIVVWPCGLTEVSIARRSTRTARTLAVYELFSQLIKSISRASDVGCVRLWLKYAGQELSVREDLGRRAAKNEDPYK